MDRLLDHDGREESAPSHTRDSAATRQQKAPPADHNDRPSSHGDPRAEDSRDVPSRRGRAAARSGREIYQINEDERQTLKDIGQFRVITSADLAQHRYRGSASSMAHDLRHLMQQGLVQMKTVWTGRDHRKVRYVALTEAGRGLVQRRGNLETGQIVYAGFVKPAELRHDAAIYPMFKREAARIAAEGGRVRRIVLDYELKRKAYSPLARARRLPDAEFAQARSEIAQAQGLKVVNEHIAFPDLRIEYETRDGAGASIDLEVASKHYHGSHAAEKVAAGFRMYASADTAERLSAALEEREITVEILSL